MYWHWLRWNLPYVWNQKVISKKYFGKWADWDNEKAFVIKILNCVWQVTASHFYDDIVEFEYVTNNELEALSWKTTLLNDQFKVYYEIDIILSGLFSMKIPSILKKLNISIYQLQCSGLKFEEKLKYLQYLECFIPSFLYSLYSLTCVS